MTLSPLTFVAVILFTAIAASALTALWMRKRAKAGTGARPQPVDRTPERAQPSSHSQQAFLRPDFQPVKLRFGTSKVSSPVMEISAVNARALPDGRRQLDPSSAQLNAFSPFLLSIPSALTAAAFGRDSYMQVRVHGHLVLACEPRSFLPFVLGAQGQVAELARLKDSDQLRRMISAGIGWQFAFATVARKHLADLHKKLDYIQGGVEDIREFLTNDRRSKIAGTLDYLRQVVKTLGRKESPAALRNQLEHIERELLRIQDHIMRDLAASTDKITASSQGRFESRKARVKSIHQLAGRIYELEKEWLLCMVARAINWQVLSVFPGDKQFKITRKESIDKSVVEFNGLLNHVYAQLYEKTAAVKSVLDSVSTTQQDRSLLAQFDLRRRLIEDNQKISSDASAIRDEVGKFASRLWSAQKPIVLALKLDQGRIVEAYEIEERQEGGRA